METVTFTQITKENQNQHSELPGQWTAFIRELDAHRNESTPDEEIAKDLQRRIDIQGGRGDMHFEVCYRNGDMVGFANFAIDLGTVYGQIDAGYGTVMGFYIKPMYRRKGFGRLFFAHIQEVLAKDGANDMYVCPDPVTGDPFWKAMGFADSGKFDPDDRAPIFIKRLQPHT